MGYLKTSLIIGSSLYLGRIKAIEGKSMTLLPTYTHVLYSTEAERSISQNDERGIIN